MEKPIVFMDPEPTAALQRYNERVRFFPAMSATIWKADQSYRRQHVTELELKALAAYATMARFFMSATCGSCTKQLDWLKGQTKSDDWAVRESLQVDCEDKYPRYPTFEVNQSLLKDATALAAGKQRGYQLKILYSINAGAWLVPLARLQDLKGCRSDVDNVRAWLAAPELQAIWVAKVIDGWKAQKQFSFYDLAKTWATYIYRRDTHEFAVGALKQFDKLVADGHTTAI
jgi:hypothetical protein